MESNTSRWYFRTILLFVAGMLISCGPQASTLPDFSELAEDNQASVVNISSVHKASDKQKRSAQIPEFFERFFDGLEDHFTVPEHDQESQGSGFIVSSDGYILTNYHVVNGADKMLVRLQDRRELQAELVGSDKQSDLALLKIDAKDLTPVKVGSSANLKVGEWVLAIGAPFGFESTVTAGIVSAVGRSLPNENYVPFIQTDVAINPGNSGGPLINLDGEVVGINSQIISRSGGFMGLSFAIPIDMAMEVVEQLKDSGEVKRGWLGVVIQGVDRDLAESFGLDKAMGALVAQVSKDSPADKAGIKAGDVVIKFNGEDVQRSSQLPQLVGRLSLGTDAKVVVVRDGKEEKLTITIGAMDKDDASSSDDSKNESKDKKETLGLVVKELTEEQSQSLDVESGVFVSQVNSGVAAKAGVRKGDVIRTLNGKTIDSVKKFEKVAKDLPKGKRVPLLIQRGEYTQFLAIKVEK